MPRREDILVGLLLATALAVTAVLAVNVGAWGSWFGGRLEVTVPASDVAGLQNGAMVAALGVPVGTVTALELDGAEVTVHLSLDPDAGLRRDVKPRIRARSLLGEKYVELVPTRGDAPLLVDGDVLPPLTPQFDVDELVNVVGPLGESMDPSVFQKLAKQLSDAYERDPERLERVLGELEVLLTNASAASEDLPQLVSEARLTLHDVRETTAAADGALARADQLMTDLEGTPETAEEARLAISELRDTLRQFRGTQAELDTVLKNLAGLTPEEVQRMLRDEGIRVRLAGRPDER